MKYDARTPRILSGTLWISLAPASLFFFYRRRLYACRQQTQLPHVGQRHVTARMTDGKNRKSSHSDLRPLNRKQRQSFAGTRGKARSDAKTANHKCNRMNEAFSRQRRRPLLIPFRGLARSACQSLQRSRYSCAMMMIYI